MSRNIDRILDLIDGAVSEPGQDAVRWRPNDDHREMVTVRPDEPSWDDGIVWVRAGVLHVEFEAAQAARYAQLVEELSRDEQVMIYTWPASRPLPHDPPLSRFYIDPIEPG